MALCDMQINSFNDILASDSPAPGGGSTAALMGAMGAALTQMVAGLTAGKKKYAESQMLMEDVLKEAEALRRALLTVIDEDTEAFGAVSAVFTMPKETEEEKTMRSEAMQEALKGCVLPPIAMMQYADKALTLAQQMLGHYNVNTASDLGVAVLGLRSCVQGAWLNVLINLGGIKDQVFVGKHRTQGEQLRLHAEHTADVVYTAVLEEIQ